LDTLKNPVFVWVTDIHINSKQAVSLPVIDMGEGNVYHANALQKALYNGWLDAWKEVKNRAGKRPIVVGIGGEIGDIDAKNRSNQYISKDVDCVRDHSIELFLPIIEMAKKIIVIRGTEAHVGNNGMLDEKIARQMEKEKKGIIHRNSELRRTKEYSYQYLRTFIGGRKFDLAHHVNMGTVPRTEKDAANHLSSDLVMEYANRWHEPLPDFAFRGHVHRYSESGDNFSIHSYIGPCWQGANPYIHRIGKSAGMPEIGLLFCDIAKKEVEYIKYEYRREAPDHI
jgi:hypothetical protein